MWKKEERQELRERERERERERNWDDVLKWKEMWNLERNSDDLPST
jgi:hypothetical protein